MAGTNSSDSDSILEDKLESRDQLRLASVTAILTSITTDEDSREDLMASGTQLSPWSDSKSAGTDLDQARFLHRGTLITCLGPMFSGKTTWLNGELTNFAVKGFRTLKIIHTDDIREDVASSDVSGTTHNPSYRSLYDRIKCVRVSILEEVDVSDFHVIGIDEAQFYPDLRSQVEKWVEHDGKHVRVSGLDGDAQKNKFGQTLDLIPLCDNVIKLSATCVLCLEELERANFRGNILGIVAPFTKRLGVSIEQKDVGGSSKYIPVCRYHHSV